MQGAFLRAPLKFRRISSRFSKRRYHPILKRWRSHKGVDYAARSGTPVRSTAEGVISLVARQRGYGKVVMIKHFNIYKTVYGHLSRFAKGVKKGDGSNKDKLSAMSGKPAWPQGLTCTMNFVCTTNIKPAFHFRPATITATESTRINPL